MASVAGPVVDESSLGAIGLLDEVSPSGDSPSVHHERARRFRLSEAMLRVCAVFLPVVAILGVSQPSAIVAVLVAGLIWLLALRSTFSSSVQMTRDLGGSQVLVGTLTGLAMVSLVGFWFPELHLAPWALLLTAALILIAALCMQALLRQSLPRRRVLVVGATQGGTELVDELARQPELPFDCLGIVGDHRSNGSSDGQIIAGTADLPAIVARERPDIVVLTDAPERWQALGALLELASPTFRIVGLHHFYEYAFGRVPVRYLSPVWFMSVLHLYQRPYSRITKRAYDLVVAAAALVLVAPIMLVLAMLVRLSTPGPIFFRQVRLGEFGSTFGMLKFRTMKDDAERPGNPMWAEEHDPRVTTVGRFLRRWRLDELPQLLNVLRGEMSIVGPRPERPEFVPELSKEVPYWSRRHLVKPGITGWAQVCQGYAADVESAADKLSYDLYYLKHRALALDLAIAAKTARVLVSGFGSR
jgi:exopolysaccharide biosynthesis polyprenyl glycosylphosphotransferase